MRRQVQQVQQVQIGRLIALGLAVALAACKSGPPAVRDEGDVRVEVERVLPKAQNLAASAVEVTLRVENGAPHPVRIDRVDYAIETGDVAGTRRGTSASAAALEAGQAAEVTFTEAVPLPEDRHAYEALLERGTFAARVEGRLVLGDGRAIPFAHQGEVATPLLPKFVVHDAQAARLADRVEVTIFLRLINENAFPVTVRGVKYGVTIEGQRLKADQAAIGTKLPQGAAEEFEVGAVLDSGTFDKAKLKAIFAAGKIGYQVTGTLEVAELEIPFAYDGEVTLGNGS